jgi:GNAT superfamily N-acetyltransferase
MTHITYKNIHRDGRLVKENELYKHVHDQEFLERYSSNYIEFLRAPRLEEFRETADYLKDYHAARGQKHVKFHLPENKKPIDGLSDHLASKGFEISFTELYAIHPNDFPRMEEDPDIRVEVISDLDDYLVFQYEQDLIYGESFAKGKVAVHRQHFEDDHVTQLLAYYKGHPAGSVDVILKEGTAEIDGLMVHDDYRKKGIASRLQQKVMELYPDRTVILVADGEDTPREMYQKQNYRYQGFQYEIQKIYTE